MCCTCWRPQETSHRSERQRDTSASANVWTKFSQVLFAYKMLGRSIDPHSERREREGEGERHGTVETIKGEGERTKGHWHTLYLDIYRQLISDTVLSEWNFHRTNTAEGKAHSTDAYLNKGEKKKKRMNGLCSIDEGDSFLFSRSQP